MEKLIAESVDLDAQLLRESPSSYDERAQSLVARLSKLSRTDLANETALENTIPAVHTIPYTFILVACCGVPADAQKGKQQAATTSPDGRLWPFIQRYLIEFDPVQIRYVGEHFSNIVGYSVRAAENSGILGPAVELLQHIILKLDPSSSILTTVHYQYVRLCLLGQAYSHAITILDLPIYHIPIVVDRDTLPQWYKHLCTADSTSVLLNNKVGLSGKWTSRKFLEYYLMGAMCYLALRRYQKALFCLEVVLVAPTAQNTASAVMLEAYKKWLLIQLVATGSVVDPPKGANQSSLRHIRTIAKPYECVVEAFKSGSVTRLRDEIQEGGQIWQQDLNIGLIQDVHQAFQKFLVVRLAKTFEALPLAEVARRASSDSRDISETITLLQKLVTTGELSATITETQSGQQMLRFLDSTTQQKSEKDVEVQFAQQKEELRQLYKNVTDNDYRLEISREYTDHLKKLRKVKKQAKIAGDRNAFEEPDEDMMMDT